MFSMKIWKKKLDHLLQLRCLVEENFYYVVAVYYYCCNFYYVACCCRIPKKNIAKLQTVQSFAAQIFTGKRKFDHITPLLQELKWLPVSYMLQYKDAVMTFTCSMGWLHHTSCIRRFKTRSQTYDQRITRQMDELDLDSITKILQVLKFLKTNKKYFISFVH